jgi:hypothetical protein
VQIEKTMIYRFQRQSESELAIHSFHLREAGHGTDGHEEFTIVDLRLLISDFRFPIA